ncbi:putative reverse transcriptase domain-containing protein, partial [Tanacetum coccineum]
SERRTEEEEEPIPEQAPAAPVGFAPQWIGGHDPNNNNGWIEEDDKDEVEAKEEDEEEMEDKEDGEMEVKDNDGENDDADVYNPYEEADPLNRPPPIPETAEREIMNALVTRSTLQPIPTIRQFSGTFYVGEGSSATVFNLALVESSSSRRLERNDMRMDSFDDDLTALDSTFRKQMQEIKKDNAVRANAVGDRGGESVDTTVVVKDVGEEKDDEGDDAAAAKDSQPSESRRSPRDPTMAPTRRSQTNPPPPLIQEAVNQLVATLGLEVANGKSWTEVKQMMIDEFCPTEEVQRLEDELRHLKLRDMNIVAYTEMFNELALLYSDVVPNEKKKVELYIKGLPEIIKGETTSSRPTMLNDAVRMTHTSMEQKIQAKIERIAKGNKRRWENNNQGKNNNRNNNNNRSNNDNCNNNNNHNNNNRNNCVNYRDNNRHNQYNQRRQDGARAMTACLFLHAL